MEIDGDFTKAGKVYDPYGFGTDACFTADFRNFCLHFKSNGDGGVVCSSGGPVQSASQTIQTAGALVFCDSTAPGCGGGGGKYASLMCEGTAEPCLPENVALCPNSCGPTRGFMNCPFASGKATPKGADSVS